MTETETAADSAVKSDQRAAAASAENFKPIRVHFYMDEVCRSEIFHPKTDFTQTKQEVLAKFGITEPAEVEKY